MGTADAFLRGTAVPIRHEARTLLYGEDSAYAVSSITPPHFAPWCGRGICLVLREHPPYDTWAFVSRATR